jgi:hypothetical protein
MGDTALALQFVKRKSSDLGFSGNLPSDKFEPEEAF